MRRGWNGITISRDTIHIEGVKFGYKSPVLFERHAVGGEYGAGWAQVGPGSLLTTFIPEDPDEKPTVVDARRLTDDINVAVVYHNPYDNVAELADFFFGRCLEADIVPYVVTKKTVFKWQEKFWDIMKVRFNRKWKERFLEAGILNRCGGELQHLISDAATMQIVRWTDGGWGMAAHNYDGDMLTDEISQVHRSPGFITSNLTGVRDDGQLIKEFEASHGTVADLYKMHLAGEETSLNPLGMVEALLGAMMHAAALDPSSKDAVANYCKCLRDSMHHAFKTGEGTRDLQGPEGNTTEQFVDSVAASLSRLLDGKDFLPPASEELVEPKLEGRHRSKPLDVEKVKGMFAEYDTNGDGYIDVGEFTQMIIRLGLAPRKRQVEEVVGGIEVK